MQSEIDPLNWTSRYVWNGQRRQAVVPAGAYVPSRQVEQADARGLEVMVPFPHGSHVRAPDTSAGDEKVPASHQSQRVGRASVFDAEPGKHRLQSSSVVFEQ